MIYTPENCYPQCVCHHDGVKVPLVFAIDTDAKTVSRYEDPLRVIGDKAAFFKMTFDSVDIEFHPDIADMPTEFEFHGLRRL